MNFLKRIFSKKSPEPDPEVEHNFSQFVPAPDIASVTDGGNMGFYMIKDSCITCGAPQAEAPDLIEHAQTGWGECYFKKQPETEDEVSRAINAVMVSCIDALRYGGKDEYVLKRMYESGMAGNCDYKPAGTYRVVTRNVVTFYFGGKINELAKTITESFIKNPQHKVIDFLSDKTSRFSFIFRWAHQYRGSLFICTHLENGFYKYKIIIADEDGQMLESVASYADELHKILKEQVHATNILWYEKEITNGGGNHIPW